MLQLEGIVVSDPEVLGGTPVFAGTRVPVKNLFDYLGSGDSIEDFLQDFDYIPRQHAIAVLEFSEKLFTESRLYEAIIGRTTSG
ncbi:MAG: DUF433 domain-containing protein [Flavisolibacter sp.]|nr:DUF433 domain-containing protein [Flavisolibacter sp.]